MKIPLYNCYWCKCAYCINHTLECFQGCIFCKQQQKFYLKENCNKFLEDTVEVRSLKKEVQKCDNCNYKVLYKKLLQLVEIFSQ